MSFTYADPQTPPHTLAHATILQVVPSMREDAARAAVNIAYVLREAGARAMIAADGGPLVRELQAYGGEWVPLITESLNPFRLQRNKRVLEELITHERVDIVHAHGPGAAWSAGAATEHLAVWFVTTVPDAPSLGRSPRGFFESSLANGDRVIAPSIHAAGAMMQRYGIESERITVIPRSVDTLSFDPAAVRRERVTTLRDLWRVSPGERIILVPGRLAPWNGQHLIPDAARALFEGGMRGALFVLAGENRSHGNYVRTLRRQAKARGVDGMIRLVGHCADMPAAFAAADVVVVPAVKPPMLGRVVAEAQAMGKPVITSAVGSLPENVVVPPRIPAELRTGWVVRPGDPAEIAHAIAIALGLDYTAYHAMAARARQFADYMFSPQSAARATRAVYTSLLALDR